MSSWIVASLVGLLSCSTAAAALPTAVKDLPSRAWQSQLAAEFSGASLLAVNQQELLIAWQSQPAMPAPVVHFLVAAPFAQVQATLRSALSLLGKFDYQQSESELAYMWEGWSELLLSRRLDLRMALAQRVRLPALQQAYQAGALSAEEVQQRLQQAEASVESTPQQRHELPVFQEKYTSLIAHQTQHYGVLGRYKSDISVQIFDFSAAFSEPVTAISISREDEYPNPNYHPLKQLKEFNILSPGPSSRLTSSVVPSHVFNAVVHALQKIAALRIAASPQQWQRLSPDGGGPAFLTLSADPASPLVSAESLRWDRLLSLERASLYPQDILILPNGDVLWSAIVLTQADGWSSRIFCLHRQDKSQTVATIWRSSSAKGIQRLALSSAGDAVWFVDAKQESEPHVYRYDVASHKVSSYRLRQRGEGDDFSLRDWQLDSQQRLVFYQSYHLPSEPGDYVYQQWRSETADLAVAHDMYFKAAMQSSRQGMMRSQMRPVLWRGPGVAWTEDDGGIAELDIASGKVQRTIALPRTEPAPWVPTALGSVAGGWIGVGFLQSQEQAPQRIFGMHVLDLQQNKLAFAALLGPSDVLAAAARSAHGRLLALAADGPLGPNIGLWDVPAKKSPLRLAASAKGGIQGLAFAPDGLSLWALCGNSLLHWTLPHALQDAHSKDTMPEQSSR